METLQIKITQIIGKENPRLPFKWQIINTQTNKLSYLICWDEDYSNNLFEEGKEYKIPTSGEYNEQYNNYALSKALYEQQKDIPIKAWYKETILSKIENTGHNYTPKEGEFRASRIPYCSRKQILEKNPDWIDLEIIPVTKEDLEQLDDEILILGENNIGQAIHEFIQNLVYEPTFEIKIERSVEKEYSINFNNELVEFKILGHIDLEIPINGETHTVDIKTYNEKCEYDVFGYLPNPNHKQQLSIYQDITNRTGDLLYINRNNGRPLFFEQSLEEGKSIFKEILTKVCSLRYCEMKRILPTRVERKFSKKTNQFELNYQCIGCEFRNYCWKCDDCKREDCDDLETDDGVSTCCRGRGLSFDELCSPCRSDWYDSQDPQEDCK